MNERSYAKDGKWVLYWMTAYRRTTDNFALERAMELAEQFQKPLLILEAVREDYQWACDRFHRFLIDGMIDNEESLKDRPVYYYPFLDSHHAPGRGLVESLSKPATAVVSDDFPCFFYPKMYSRLASLLTVPLEVVDSNGLLPIRQEDRTFTVAHSFRRAMQKVWESGSPQFPKADPWDGVNLPGKLRMPKEVTQRWPLADLRKYRDRSRRLEEFRINHEVASTPEVGGSRAGQACLERFVRSRLASYDEARNEPSKEGSSGLSPYLHFGHVASHRVFQAIMEKEKWTRQRLKKPNGKINGFWGVSENAEAFLDQLATWREIGFNSCVRDPHFDRYDSLPDWARQTMAEHAADPRPHIYSLAEWERAETHDRLWNAAQRQLVMEGRIHNYLRMLWGKKILHWSRTPEEALEVMIELNNKYALDGRDPNSYSGIFWVLGRFDRAWGPERPIFGKIRYMTSDSTARKFDVGEYMKRYG